MSFYQNENYLTGNEAAALLGVSRRTIYKWIHEGRLSMPLSRSDIEARKPKPRQRGPRRSPYSIRYTQGRHTFRSRAADE